MFDLLDQVEASLTAKRVGIIEFAESDRFCNKPLYPRQRLLLKLMFLEELDGSEEDVLDYWIAGGRNGTEISISPDIRERAQWARDNQYPHFREVVLSGGRRSSKGFMTGVALAKVMWDCLQLQDPGTYYGIDPDKNIMFSCVAGSEQQAKEYQYSDLSNTIESCRAFEPYIVKSLETEIRVATSVDLTKISRNRAGGNKTQKDIARLRGKALAANAGTLRGSATMGLCIDEMAHMIPGESKASADEVYNAAEPSLDQFGQDGMIFLNSSPYSKVGMFYEKFVQAMRAFDPEREPGFETPDLDDMGQGDTDAQDGINGNPLMLGFRFPSWALFEGYQKDPQRRFRNAITVSADWDPNEKDEDGKDVWSAQDRKKIVQAKQNESSKPDVYKVERRAHFAEVTDSYLNPEMVDRMFLGVPDGYTVDKKGIPLLNLAPIKSNWGEGQRYIYRYKAHVDPSSTTAGFGFALGHTEEFTNAYGQKEEHVVFDIIKRWEPKNFPGAVIRWGPILDELELYCDIFRPYEITFDQHQSHEPIEQLQERFRLKGINTRVYEKVATNELNWNRAEIFKTALYQGLVHGPFDTRDIQWAAQELKFLQQKNTGGKFPRVDRQEIGPVQTKDMADCMMEVTDSLIGNLMTNRIRERLANSSLSPGAPGGYQIGGFAGAGGLNNLSDYYRSKKTGEQSRVAGLNMRSPNLGAGARRGRGRPRGASW